MVNKKNFLKNFSYTFSSNIITFLLNAIILLLLPKILNTSDFGYFQYYMVVVGFTIYMHFGWIDGIYLRYSGNSYEEIDKSIFSGQFKALMVFGVIQFIILLGILLLLPIEVNKKYAIFIAIIAIMFMIPKIFTYVLMQVTSRFKEYSIILIIEKLVFSLLLVGFIVAGVRSYSIFILADLIGRATSAAYGIYVCRDLLKIKAASSKENFNELYKNFKSGIFIMIANISSILVVSVVQFVIENNWSIETFGKVSLALNISKAVLIVISAIGIIVFPMLKKVAAEYQPSIFKNVRTVLLPILFIMMLGYFPATILVNYWLPNYKSSIAFLMILFPFFVFESKTALLLNTYFKLLRYEKKLALINTISVVLSLMLSVMTAYVFNSLYGTVMVILLAVGLRSLMLELFIIKKLKVKKNYTIFLEILLVVLFIVVNMFLSFSISFIIYSISLALYVYVFKNNIYQALKHVR